MLKRAAICIGVNKADGMTPLSAASRDAARFEQWAGAQGCDTRLLTDDSSKVRLSDIYDAIKAFVDHGIYDQLIIYFSGHGILKAPGAEYWLLSGAPANSNEAVNLVGSIEEARNSAIPHVAFVSDACRSAADTHQLRAIHGGVIFPPLKPPTPRSEIDVYYATLPGDPANEVPQATATASHKGLFTDCLLDVVHRPPPEMVERASLGGRSISVLSTRTLKPYLESTVPVKAGQIHITLKQHPDIQVGTALPKYFAEVADVLTKDGVTTPIRPLDPGPPSSGPALRNAWKVMKSDAYAETLPNTPIVVAARSAAVASGMVSQIERIKSAKGRERFETRTGFSVHGAFVERVVSHLKFDPPFQEATDSNADAFAHHVRVYERGTEEGFSILLALNTGTAVMLPVCPGMIGTVVVEQGRIISVNYVPSGQSHRFPDYEQAAPQMEQLKAYAAVASRAGTFELPDESADDFASRIRQFKGIDPMMGVYASYAYAQIGQDRDVQSVFRYMRNDELPIPFDVALLALRREPPSGDIQRRIAPFGPMLSQGWARLDQKHPLWRPVHGRLQPFFIPSLFATLDKDGAAIAAAAIDSGEVR